MRVDSLPYVEATILELLRYKTLAPLALPHRTMNDTEIGGYFIPGGTTVSWHADDNTHRARIYAFHALIILKIHASDAKDFRKQNSAGINIGSQVTSGRKA